MQKVQFGPVSSVDHLDQILELQRANVKAVLDTDDMRREGFVTCQHDFDLLSRMNDPHPHSICTDGKKVVGYALVMLPRWRDELEVLQSMFDQLEKVRYQGASLQESDYVIMGQVCIEKSYRGMGLFRKMYEEYRLRLSPGFKYCITEVESSNTRSMNAHLALGWKILHRYQPGDGNDWVIIIWDWT